MVVPEREHDKVLRMGQPQRLEQRPVHREHRTVGDRQRKAHLLLEGKGIDVFRYEGHNTTVRQ